MFGFGAFGDQPFGGISSETLALTSDFLQEIVTRFVEERKFPILPQHLHHHTSLDTSSLIISLDNVRLSHAEYSNDQTEMAQAKELIRIALKN